MTENDSLQRQRSSLKKYILFGVPRLGTNIVLTIVDFALLTLYTLGFQLEAWQTFLAFSLGKLSIAASQFLLGWLSDAKYTRWGRRKPYIIILSPLLAISFIFLTLPNIFISISDKLALFNWLLLWNVIFQASYGLTTPYNSWMAEQFEVNERPKASQFLNLFIYIGAGLAQIFSLFVLASFKDQVLIDPNIIPAEYIISVLLFAVLIIVLFYLVVFLMPTEPHFEIKSSLKSNLMEILNNRNYLLINLLQGFASISWAIIGPMMLVYIEEVLNFGTMEKIVAGAIIIIGILIFLYVWRLLIERIGKKKSLLYLFLIAIVVLPFSLIGLVPMGSYLVFGIIFLIGVVAALGGWNLFPYIFYADLAEDSEKKTGELKAGIYQGFSSILLNIFQAIGLAFSSLIAFLMGDALFYVWWGPICSLILIGAYFYSRKFIKIDFEWEKR
jgi:GPH family glycoside/pentoside/hexuronide:cation symporter